MRPDFVCHSPEGRFWNSADEVSKAPGSTPALECGESLTSCDGESTKGILLQPPAPWIDNLRLSMTRRDFFSGGQRSGRSLSSQGWLWPGIR